MIRKHQRKDRGPEGLADEALDRDTHHQPRRRPVRTPEAYPAGEHEPDGSCSCCGRRCGIRQTWCRDCDPNR